MRAYGKQIKMVVPPTGIWWQKLASPAGSTHIRRPAPPKQCIFYLPVSFLNPW